MMADYKRPEDVETAETLGDAERDEISGNNDHVSAISASSARIDNTPLSRQRISIYLTCENVNLN